MLHGGSYGAEWDRVAFLRTRFEIRPIHVFKVATSPGLIKYQDLAKDARCHWWVTHLPFRARDVFALFSIGEVHCAAFAASKQPSSRMHLSQHC